MRKLGCRGLLMWTIPSLLFSGCSLKQNPSLSASYEEARTLAASMRDHPVPARNPIVILGGWRDPGLVAWRIRRSLEPIFLPETSILHLSFGFSTSFEQARRDVIELVDAALPSTDPVWTTTVDVIGFSMGGLVARYAAADNGGGRRLGIDRLFTVATPHRGARLAFLPFFDPMARAMRPRSNFLRSLDRALETATYTMIPYTRLSDPIVGEGNTAPENQTPLWVSARPFQTSHLFSAFDARIQADIMRRLRGEPALFTEPYAPLPEAD